MSDDATAPGGSEGEAVTAGLPADAPEEFNTPKEAADYFASLQEKRKEPPAERAEPATAEPELSGEDNAAPPEEATSEDASEDAPAEQPPRDLPRSWTKDRTELWNKLDPSLQDFLIEKDSEASKEVRRTQNEAAEERKALKAEREAAEAARKSYEAKLPALMESLQRQSEFADIKTMDDVRKLQAEDPFRFQAWQVYQMDAQAVQAEKAQAEQRQLQAKQAERSTYEREQAAKLHDLVPEMKDPAKATELRTKAVKMLTDDYGFTQSDLEATMQSDEGYKLLTDARWQKLIADGLKYAELKKAPLKAAPATLPPVQRPGTARPSGSSASEREQTLTRKSSLDLKEATELYQLQSRRQRRAS